VIHLALTIVGVYFLVLIILALVEGAGALLGVAVHAVTTMNDPEPVAEPLTAEQELAAQVAAKRDVRLVGWVMALMLVGGFVQILATQFGWWL